jgi:DNA-binding Lrp family transcriptional regulator
VAGSDVEGSVPAAFRTGAGVGIAAIIVPDVASAIDHWWWADGLTGGSVDSPEPDTRWIVARPARPVGSGGELVASHRKGHIVVQAFILIQTEVGQAAAVAQAIAELPGVTSAEDVTGPYDVIVRAEANTVDELGKLVVARVQGVAGITRTLTCPVVHL